jgi:protein TonB
MAYVDRDRSRDAAVSGIAATVMVGGIGFVLASGLAMTVIHHVDPPLLVHEWRAPPPPPPTDPVRPRHTRAATTVAVPVPTTRIVPVLPPPPTTTASTLRTFDLPPAGTDTDTLPTLPPAIDRSVHATPRGDPGAWVTSEDYPPSALRAGQQGTTGVRLEIGIDGRATACTVTTSSGSDALDREACRNLMRRARFEPARDAGGAPIASSYTSRIAWRLPTE